MLDSGYVEWLRNLSESQRKMLMEFVAKYYLPWRFVHNENSMTTPTRVVYDASAVTKTGYALNTILATGVKSLNPLQQIFIAFRLRPIAVHTDL